jgi:hypothetical protein
MPHATAIDDGCEAPKAGDSSLCGECGTLLVFAGPAELRPMTQAEFEALDPLQHRTLVAAKLFAEQRLSERLRATIDPTSQSLLVRA